MKFNYPSEAALECVKENNVKLADWHDAWSRDSVFVELSYGYNCAAGHEELHRIRQLEKAPKPPELPGTARTTTLAPRESAFLTDAGRGVVTLGGGDFQVLSFRKKEFNADLSNRAAADAWGRKCDEADRRELGGFYL